MVTSRDFAMGAGPVAAVAEGDGETYCSKVCSDDSPGRTKFAEPSSDRAPVVLPIAGAEATIYLHPS